MLFLSYFVAFSRCDPWGIICQQMQCFVFKFGNFLLAYVTSRPYSLYLCSVSIQCYVNCLLQRKDGISNVQANLTLAKMSSYRVWLILDPDRGYLGASSAHLAALWITRLASVLSGGDSARLPARTWFCSRSRLRPLALTPCEGKAGAALWDTFASSPLLCRLSSSCKKEWQFMSSESLNREKIELCALHSSTHCTANTQSCTVLLSTKQSKARLCLTFFWVPTAVWFT